jgi:hypothetical protein
VNLFHQDWRLVTADETSRELSLRAASICAGLPQCSDIGPGLIIVPSVYAKTCVINADGIGRTG